MNIFKRICSWFNKKETINNIKDCVFDSYDRDKDNNCLNPIQMAKNRETLRNDVCGREEYNKHAFSKSKRYDEVENSKNVVKRIGEKIQLSRLNNLIKEFNYTLYKEEHIRNFLNGEFDYDDTEVDGVTYYRNKEEDLIKLKELLRQYQQQIFELGKIQI